MDLTFRSFFFFCERRSKNQTAMAMIKMTVLVPISAFVHETL